MSLLPYLLHGGLDMASLTDVERHISKLMMGVSQYRICGHFNYFKQARRRRERGDPPGTFSKRLAPMVSRMQLDALMAMRMAGQMKLTADYRAELKPRLAEVIADAREDALIRAAARQTTALLDGAAPADVSANLPPLKDVLARLYYSPSILIVAHPHRAPLWNKPAAPGRMVSEMSMRDFVSKHADAITWMDLLASQFHRDAGGELPFELARVFGNARWDRVVAAVWFGRRNPIFSGGGIEWTIAMNGVFPADKWAEDFKELKPKDENGLKTFHAAGVTVAFSSDTLIVGSRVRTAEEWMIPSVAAQWDKYSKAGADGKHILWLYFSRLALPELGIPLTNGFEGLKDIIAQVAWNKPNLELRLSAAAVSDAQAQAVSARVLEALKAMGNAFEQPLFKDSPARQLAPMLNAAVVGSDRTAITAAIQFKDLTPEALFNAWMSPATAGLEQK
jgi:hypothetical protein